VVITFLGTLIRAFILGFLGWQFGSLYQTISTEISYLEEISVVVIVIALVIYFLWGNIRNKLIKNYFLELGFLKLGFLIFG